VLAAALAGRPELRAKLEALKRQRAAWVTFEEGGGGGGGGGVGASGGCGGEADEEEAFPDDYGELQAADTQALATSAAAPPEAAAGAGTRPVSPLSDAKRAAIAAAMANIKLSPRLPPSPFLEKAVENAVKAGRASIEAHRRELKK